MGEKIQERRLCEPKASDVIKGGPQALRLFLSAGIRTMLEVGAAKISPVLVEMLFPRRNAHMCIEDCEISTQFKNTL